MRIAEYSVRNPHSALRTLPADAQTIMASRLNPMSTRANFLQRLTEAGRIHQRELGVGLLLRCVKWLLAAVLAGFGLDVFLHLDSVWRLVLLLALLAGAAALLGWSWYAAKARRNRLEHIARLLEQREPSLGSKLINLLQLQSQAEDSTLSPLTRELARAAVGNYAEALATVPLEQLARTNAIATEARRAGVALVLFAAVLGLFYQVTLVEAVRFADPFGDHPPYSLTQLELIEPRPQGTNVIYGRSFVAQAKAHGHRPKELFVTAHPPGRPDQAITLPMFDKGSVGFHQQLDNIRNELVVFVHTKNKSSISKQGRVGVILTPQLDKAFVRIAPPAYTGIKPEEKPYLFKGVQALAGSEVRLRLQSNRPLRSGTVEVFHGDAPPLITPLAKTADQEVTGAFSARDSGRLRLNLVDADGIPSLDHWESGLTVTHDLPPEISVTEPPRDAYAAMDFKVPVQLDASDDYGLAMMRLHRGLNGVYSPPKEFRYEGIVRTARETFEFDFQSLGVQPGDVVSFFAEAVDNAPEPHLTRSHTVNLMIIGVEDYNNFLRERTDISMLEGKYEELLSRLHDLVEQQKQLGEQARKAAEQLARSDGKNQEALQRELDTLLAKQNEVNQKLNKQAEAMEQFVRDQPLYDVERELQALLREQAGAIRDSAAANDQTSREIARRSSPTDGRRALGPDMFADFKQASDEQLRRLGGAKESAQSQVNSTLQDLGPMQDLVKDFNQFEALYQSQQTLTDQVRAYNRAGQLNREDQLALKELAATQKQVGELLAELASRLREDAGSAEKLYPKAAKSGRQLAEQVQQSRMPPLADRATAKMLAADGQGSFAAADRLREEMANLFGQCQAKGGSPGQDELDQYLRLSRSLNPGRTFAQMMRSRNFMRPGGKQGFGSMQGEGDGLSGESGYAITTQQALEVMGNESFIARSSAAERASSKAGFGAGKPGDDLASSKDTPTDTLKNLNPVNRKSGAVASESLVEEYSEVVDKYFKAITK